ncbi:type II secretion system F family protein [Mariniblastus sp.]|nr:type II secretion system F family protein [Mariniblastus sp.]
MPEFSYTARDMTGQLVTGRLSANTESDAVATLSGQSLYPIKVASDEAKPKGNGFSFGGGRVSAQKISVFYEQLSTLMTNGVPMLRSLQILQEQAQIPIFRNALTDVISRIEDGETLSDSFKRHPKVFSEMAVNMSKAGAEGGFLEDALTRVASFTEQQAELKSKTIGALIYPMVLATIGTIIVAVLLIFFVPSFGAIFEVMRKDGKLPTATIWLLGFSEFLQSWWWGIAIAGVFAFLLIKMQLSTPKGRLFADKWKLKVPLLGSVLLSLAICRFCRVLGTLLKNGVPILRGLEISAEATGNKILEAAIVKASDNITSGETLAKPLAASNHFPRNVTEMISVAEESNTLDDVLINISEGLEKQTMRKLDIMVKLIEPLMLVVMAGVVMFVVIALLMPIVKMGQAI